MIFVFITNPCHLVGSLYVGSYLSSYPIFYWIYSFCLYCLPDGHQHLASMLHCEQLSKYSFTLQSQNKQRTIMDLRIMQWEFSGYFRDQPIRDAYLMEIISHLARWWGILPSEFVSCAHCRFFCVKSSIPHITAWGLFPQH